MFSSHLSASQGALARATAPRTTHQESKQEQSLFFEKLPLKIRHRIYKAYQDIYLTSVKGVTLRDGLGDFDIGTCVSKIPGLLLTCKKMSKEATTILENKATLKFTTPFFGGMASETIIKSIGNWYPARYEEIYLELKPSHFGRGYAADTMREQLEALFMPLSTTKIERVVLRFNFVNVHGASTDVRRLEDFVLPHLVRFAYRLPCLKVIELRGVFPAHWTVIVGAQVYQRRGASVNVMGRVDPPRTDGLVDQCAWLRVGRDYRPL